MLTLAISPPEVVEYRLGNRCALDWVIDQYQISTGKRSGITSDPNDPDDEEHIVRLVDRAVPVVSLPNPRVSIETVKIVNTLLVDRRLNADSRQLIALVLLRVSSAPLRLCVRHLPLPHPPFVIVAANNPQLLARDKKLSARSF
jgi:hypothetical protein